MQNYKNVLLGKRESFLNAISCTLNSTESTTKESGRINRNFIKFFHSVQKKTAFVVVLMILLILPAMLAAQNTSGNGSNSLNRGDKETGLPTKFELRQNPANELNPTTRVDFALPTDSKVTIKIFDAENKEVLILLSNEKAAGYHKIQFYAPHISNGSYYYSFTAESGGVMTTLTEQMLLSQ